MPVEIDVWAATHVGRVRKNNEDRCVVGEWRSGPANGSWRGKLPAHAPWILVADGMGGHEAGEVASELALDVVSQGIGQVASSDDVTDLLETANMKLHEAMYGGTGHYRMGTTIVGLAIVKQRIAVFNVGDSRAYGLVDGELAQLSVDHSVGAGRTNSAWLTQSLGGTSRRRPVLPAISWLTARTGSTFVLCTDGLTADLQDDEIAAVLKRHRDDPAAALVAAALDAGGRDNITVVVASLSCPRY